MKLIPTLGLSILICGAFYFAPLQENVSEGIQQTNEVRAKVESQNEDSNLGSALTSDTFVVAVKEYSRSASTKCFKFTLTQTEESYGAYENYTYGYYADSTSEDLYGKVRVDLIDANKNKVSKVSQTVTRTDSSGNFDPFGYIFGKTEFNFYATISCAYDLDIDLSSIVVYNIFPSEKVTDENGAISILPDLNNPCHKDVDTTTMTSKKKNDLADYINYDGTKFIGGSTYSDVYSIQTNVDAKILDVYKDVMDKYYTKYLSYLESGAYYVRVRISFSGTTRYIVKTDNPEQPTTVIIPPGSFISLAASGVSNTIIFIRNINGNLLNFQIYNFTLVMTIVDPATAKEVDPSASFKVFFGSMDFRMEDILNSDNSIAIAKVDTGDFKNLAQEAIIYTISFICAYLVVVIAAYFYLKNKYKNDEFRKMDSRNYFKNVGMGLVFLGSLFVEIIYIIWRTSVFENTSIVSNPLDAVIVIMGVVAILFGGYWVKYFITMAKNNIEKRRVERLKLNYKAIDDGIN